MLRLSTRIRPDEFKYTKELYPLVINKFLKLLYGEKGPAMAYWSIYGWKREAK